MYKKRSIKLYPPLGRAPDVPKMPTYRAPWPSRGAPTSPDAESKAFSSIPMQESIETYCIGESLDPETVHLLKNGLAHPKSD